MKGKMFLNFCLLMGALSSSASSEEWKATVVKKMNAVVTSCVVVPCLFSHPKEPLPTSRLRGKWHHLNNRDKLIYSEDNTRIDDNFRGRTRLLGNLGKGNCTLEIGDIKDYDSGPFCFRIELARTGTDTNTKDMFSFVEDCVTFTMIPDPESPKMTSGHPVEGLPFTITCSVMHTCPTSSPEISWSWESKNIMNHNREIHPGLWEVSSILTFIPWEKDDQQEITCSAKFSEQKTSTQKMTLYVKRSVKYNHIIIPVVAVLGSAAIFGGLCLIMMKKYKRRIAELQNQDGTMLNRLSRMSRRIYNPSPRRVHSGHRPENNTAFFKPPFPSPKSKPRVSSHSEDMDQDDYINTADLNIYGNL